MSGWFGLRMVIPATCDEGDWYGSALLHTIISEKRR